MYKMAATMSPYKDHFDQLSSNPSSELYKDIAETLEKSHDWPF